MYSVAENLMDVKTAIETAAKAAGRAPSSVRLLAVSKTFPVDSILDAYRAGQRLFGENRAQEIEGKAAILPKDIEWHFIGHLQGNKAAGVVKVADWIHSVDSIRLLERIDRLAGEQGRSPRILIEVNISGEGSKCGLRPEEAHGVAEATIGKSHVRLSGLMTMAPYGASKEQLADVFSGLRGLRDDLECKLGLKLPELSMGMSGDYVEAIAQGSTIVRVGSAIFGNR